MTQQLLKVEVAAEILSVSRTKMYELIGTGQVASFKIGRNRRVPSCELDRWIDSQIGLADD